VKYRISPRKKELPKKRHNVAEEIFDDDYAGVEARPQKSNHISWFFSAEFQEVPYTLQQNY
jgi:hypothetical protein